MPRTRPYTAEVYLNGEFYCAVTGDDVAILAKDQAAKLKERQAAIADRLKIRDLSKVEVRMR